MNGPFHDDATSRVSDCYANDYDYANDEYGHDVNDYVRDCKFSLLRLLYFQNLISIIKSKVNDFHYTLFRDDDGYVSVSVLLSAGGLRDDHENNRGGPHSGHCAIY